MITHRAHKAAYRRVAKTYQEQFERLPVDNLKLLNANDEALDYID